MKPLKGVPALALIAMMQPAFADVSAQQVWDDLEAYLEGFGYDVTGDEALSGGVLTVSNVVMSVPVPDEEDVDVAIRMDSVVFTETGDGAVSVAFPPVMPITVSGPEATVRIDYTHDGLEMMVSGDDSTLTYAYSANQLGLALAELVVEGETIPRANARFDATMGPVEGSSSTVYDGSMRTITQEMSLGTLAYSGAFTDPDGGNDSASMSGELVGVMASGDSVVPDELDMEDMLAAVAAGFGGSGEMRHGGSKLEFSVTERSGVTSGQMSSGSGLLEVSFGGEGLSYTLGNTDFVMALTTPDVPFPINAAMAETGFTIALPVEASDTPQDAALGVTLGGFTMSDMLWNIFDPGAALPRDPATVALDLTAQVTPFFSLLDAEKMEELGMSDEVPGELNAVTLNALTVEAAGAKLTGTGDFTFDNTDLETFDGMPRPTGKIDLQVEGHNGLIDRLISMGLLAEEDAMGARMMLSMFTVPGSGADTATSTIEINDQAQIFANGQRIQ
ncbi:DUF2125 domain-containing protein [Cognatishimia sp. F0-27]|uniref:DUF2125 domain-containing protein n=1 Tax=Cognatishimia sp. F0-27 TaxID=2816855 RepID=UPI001D0C9300|nr:DUF2125 domain-containing protein [Cognatishimia sp. F0-27]MCC1491410.1 DUF2125 domain-containing protein [Cognatishimia sp. F0-27]